MSCALEPSFSPFGPVAGMILNGAEDLFRLDVRIHRLYSRYDAVTYGCLLTNRSPKISSCSSQTCFLCAMKRSET